ncbi:HAD family hydrolase [Paenibacillus xerothermodurans]|uniref:Phosphoserine phosphatase n=1 Tax=Paenibacillus xerothermodurans TaxID=1977292 RepID=A0A2W1NSS7_PAEXE|nr:HAD family hydrolase [Paenibacillus xerothermodurans]PZE21833.1 HAD family hydrolase [Paenibacillus xerothermodurans]
MSIQALLFDLDDTLLWDERSVREAFKATCEEAATHVSVDPVALEQAVRREARALYESYETFPFTQMIGINPFEGLWANFTEGHDENFRELQRLAPAYRTASWTQGLTALGVDDPELGYRLGELFPAERRKRPIVYDETFEVLEQLKGRYKLLLLTNGSPDLQKEKLAGVPQLAPYFDHIVISGNFGEGKPAASIFHHAMALLGITSDEGVMVGDKLTTDILGSHRVGMRNIWINRHGMQHTGDVIPAHEITDLREIEAIIAAVN